MAPTAPTVGRLDTSQYGKRSQSQVHVATPEVLRIRADVRSYWRNVGVNSELKPELHLIACSKAEGRGWSFSAVVGTKVAVFPSHSVAVRIGFRMAVW